MHIGVDYHGTGRSPHAGKARGHQIVRRERAVFLTLFPMEMEVIVKDRRWEVAGWNYSKKGMCRLFLHESFFPLHFITTVGILNPFQKCWHKTS